MLALLMSSAASGLAQMAPRPKPAARAKASKTSAVAYKVRVLYDIERPEDAKYKLAGRRDTLPNGGMTLTGDDYLIYSTHNVRLPAQALGRGGYEAKLAMLLQQQLSADANAQRKFLKAYPDIVANQPAKPATQNNTVEWSWNYVTHINQLVTPYRDTLISVATSDASGGSDRTTTIGTSIFRLSKGRVIPLSFGLQSDAYFKGKKQLAAHAQALAKRAQSEFYRPCSRRNILLTDLFFGVRGIEVAYTCVSDDEGEVPVDRVHAVLPYADYFQLLWLSRR